MSLRPKSTSDVQGTHEPTHRSQFHIHRIVGDRAPVECVPIAIDAFWRTLSATIGLEAAERVRLGRTSVDPNRILMRIWTPIVDADEVSRLPATFDDDDWHEALDEIAWNDAGADLNRIRRRTLDAVRKERRAMRKQEPSGLGVDERGAMEMHFRVPEGGDPHSEAILCVRRLWTCLREKKGADVADSVKLRCIGYVDGHGVVCAVAPMFMASEIAISTGMQEHPGRRYVIDGKDWHAPAKNLLDVRMEAIRPRNAYMEIMSGLVRMVSPKDSSAGHGHESASQDAAVPAIQEEPKEETTPWYGVRPQKSRAKTMVRISVPAKNNTYQYWEQQGFEPLVDFVTTVYKDELLTNTGAIRIVGTIRQPASLSVVLQLPVDLATRSRGMISRIRVIPFDPKDSDKLDHVHTRRFAESVGAVLYRTDVENGIDPDRTRIFEIQRKNALMRLAATSDPMLPLGVSDVLHRAWSMIGAAYGFLTSPFAAMDQIALGAEPSTTTARIEEIAKPTIWNTLRTLLPEESARVDDIERSCSRFAEVAARWGDEGSAQTASSVDGLVARMADELNEIVMWAEPHEARQSASGLLATLERLGRRAEDERARLVSHVTDRLDTTRRFVDTKLDDAGLSPVVSIGRAA